MKVHANFFNVLENAQLSAFYIFVEMLDEVCFLTHVLARAFSVLNYWLCFLMFLVVTQMSPGA